MIWCIRICLLVILLWSNTPADVNKQVFIVNPDLLYRPGPRMLEGLLELTSVLHTALTPARFLEKQEAATEESQTD